MHPLRQLMFNNRKQGYFKAEKKNDSETTVYVYDLIVANDEEAEWFGGVSPEAFSKTLSAVDTEILNIRYNTPGGDVFAARAMEQAVINHPSKTRSHVDGYAASAGSYMALAADEVIIAESAFFMIHKAWTFAYGNSDDLMQTAELLEQIDETLVNTYAKSTGQKPEDILTWMAAETWIGAEKAVELGFADSIAGENKAKNRTNKSWNLSAYSNPPEIDRIEPAVPEKLTNLDELKRKLEFAEKVA